MGNQPRKIVVVDLLDERMLWCDKHIFEQTRLSRRYVGKPATHPEQQSLVVNVYLGQVKMGRSAMLLRR